MAMFICLLGLWVCRRRRQRSWVGETGVTIRELQQDELMFDWSTLWSSLDRHWTVLAINSHLIGQHFLLSLSTDLWF